MKELIEKLNDATLDFRRHVEDPESSTDELLKHYLALRQIDKLVTDKELYKGLDARLGPFLEGMPKEARQGYAAYGGAPTVEVKEGRWEYPDTHRYRALKKAVADAKKAQKEYENLMEKAACLRDEEEAATAAASRELGEQLEPDPKRWRVVDPKSGEVIPPANYVRQKTYTLKVLKAK